MQELELWQAKRSIHWWRILFEKLFNGWLISKYCAQPSYYFHKWSLRNFVYWDSERQWAFPHCVPGRSTKRQNQGGRSAPVAWRRGGKISYKWQAGTKMMNWQQNHSTKDNTSWKQKTLLRWFMIWLHEIYTPNGTEDEGCLLGGKWRKSEDAKTWQWKYCLTGGYKLNIFCFLGQQTNCMGQKSSTPAEDKAM